jgi:general secretion pathway protein A
MDIHSAFGFRQAPFTREIRAAERFTLPHLDDVRSRLLRVVEMRMSGALISPAGLGKTSLLRAVMDELPEARYRVRYVKVTDLSKRDMCREIATACGVQPAGSYPMLVRRLQEGFEHAYRNDGLRPVLVVDEAHDMRPDVLGMLRVLTNFDMDSKLVVSLVLAGQAKLGTLLKRAALEDVAQRIAYFGALRLLSRDETRSYIDHRCSIAGAAASPFDNGASDAIFEITQGNMRAIDRVARGALEEAATAGAQAVSHREVIAARKNLWPA